MPSFCSRVSISLKMSNNSLISTALELDGHQVSPQNFRLPTLGPILLSLARKLHEGCGFFLLRGLDPCEFSTADNVLIFLGIASHIGNLRGRQNKNRHMLTHVTDVISPVPRSKRHGINSTVEIESHTEVISDILALQTIRKAATGGTTTISPLWSIYNDLAKRRPDVIRLLSEPLWPLQNPYTPPNICRPLLFHTNGKVILSFDPGSLRRLETETVPGVPPLCDSQLEAIEVLLSTAAQYRYPVTAQPGDMLFINNFSHMHSRSAYVDEGCQRRHLIRLWLHNQELGWQLPGHLRPSWEKVFANDDNMPEKYPVEPVPIYKAPRITMGSGSTHLIEDDSDD
ncbi:Clavaminate synthase-like protein [Eremomyces bilateralis CBS 781.70]|uniref:Clavaminate synthase-like protein n=1 Tax=Eremomyces bilateralis CBS 781.70 TaxID=1392243 RepID=A0A6G1GBS5_9PEZI|nr:Clavaminate synthase-like protein [Eremomyces bilateralis CBS 781.70]KAF1815432.1 Clavaminate synthase-like protein [Eremomyces bilateralis CBS 781.70]